MITVKTDDTLVLWCKATFDNNMSGLLMLYLDFVYKMINYILLYYLKKISRSSRLKELRGLINWILINELEFFYPLTTYTNTTTTYQQDKTLAAILTPLFIYYSPKKFCYEFGTKWSKIWMTASDLKESS